MPDYHRRLALATSSPLPPSGSGVPRAALLPTGRSPIYIALTPKPTTTTSPDVGNPDQNRPTTRAASTPNISSPKRNSVYQPLTPSKRRQTGSTASLATRTNPPTSPAVNTRQLRTDRLGTLVSELTAALDASPSWEDFVTTFRGRSYLSPELEEVDHPATELLREWREQGVPVHTTSEPWNAELSLIHI